MPKRSILSLVLAASGIGTTSPDAALEVSGAYGSNAALIIDQLNSGNILSASAGGTLRLALTNTGELQLSPSTAAGISLNPFSTSAGNTAELRFLELAANGSNYTGFKSPDSLASNLIYTLPATVGYNYILQTTSGGVLSWIDPGTLPSSNYWTLSNEQLYPKNALYHDVLLGGTSTASATLALQAATGDLTLDGEIRLLDDGSTYYTGFKAPSDLTGTQNYLYTLPDAYPGSTGFILSSNTSGVLSWLDPGTLPSSNYWRLNAGTVSPYNDTLDVLFGANATGHQPHAPMHPELPPVAAHDPRALLAPMLQGIQPVGIGQLGRVGMAKNAEDTAVVFGMMLHRARTNSTPPDSLKQGKAGTVS